MRSWRDAWFRCRRGRGGAFEVCLFLHSGLQIGHLFFHRRRFSLHAGVESEPGIPQADQCLLKGGNLFGGC